MDARAQRTIRNAAVPPARPVAGGVAGCADDPVARSPQRAAAEPSGESDPLPAGTQRPRDGPNPAVPARVMRSIVNVTAACSESRNRNAVPVRTRADAPRGRRPTRNLRLESDSGAERRRSPVCERTVTALGTAGLDRTRIGEQAHHFVDLWTRRASNHRARADAGSPIVRHF